MECRNRHETTAHNPNDVKAERNRMRCGLCQGYTTMEFQCRNDFALIMHLSQVHLPLHCKKCLTVSDDDFFQFSLFFFTLSLSCDTLQCVPPFHVQCHTHQQFVVVFVFSLSSTAIQFNR